MLPAGARGGIFAAFSTIHRETIEGLFGVYLHSTGVWAFNFFAPQETIWAAMSMLGYPKFLQIPPE